ncbi:MAG: DUF4124 domain-containing protein [Serpentinimonas sp.]|nr:DUF4124 domain-containing protein [Serpentinimonas sp.]MDO9610318.1 DUF4124 domain-containing protein [Serpentinimonas sp.]
MRKLFFAFTLTLLLAAAAQAAPTWVWLDENGRRVASDMPPPATVPDQRILRRPAASVSTAAPTASPAAPAAPAATATPPRPAPATGAAAGRLTDEQLRQQVEQRNAQIRADNCQRARASLESLQAGASQPLYMVNEQGQRVTLDEAMKRAETVRLRQIVRDNCTPLPLPAAANQAGAGAAAPAGAPASSPTLTRP